MDHPLGIIEEWWYTLWNWCVGTIHSPVSVCTFLDLGECFIPYIHSINDQRLRHH